MPRAALLLAAFTPRPAAAGTVWWEWWPTSAECEGGRRGGGVHHFWAHEDDCVHVEALRRDDPIRILAGEGTDFTLTCIDPEGPDVRNINALDDLVHIAVYRPNDSCSGPPQRQLPPIKSNVCGNSSKEAALMRVHCSKCYWFYMGEYPPAYFVLLPSAVSFLLVSLTFNYFLQDRIERYIKRANLARKKGPKALAELEVPQLDRVLSDHSALPCFVCFLDEAQWGDSVRRWLERVEQGKPVNTPEHSDDELELEDALGTSTSEVPATLQAFGAKEPQRLGAADLMKLRAMGIGMSSWAKERARARRSRRAGGGAGGSSGAGAPAEAPADDSAANDPADPADEDAFAQSWPPPRAKRQAENQQRLDAILAALGAPAAGQEPAPVSPGSPPSRASALAPPTDQRTPRKSVTFDTSSGKHQPLTPGSPGVGVGRGASFRRRDSAAARAPLRQNRPASLYVSTQRPQRNRQSSGGPLRHLSDAAWSPRASSAVDMRAAAASAPPPGPSRSEGPCGAATHPRTSPRRDRLARSSTAGAADGGPDVVTEYRSSCMPEVTQPLLSPETAPALPPADSAGQCSSAGGAAPSAARKLTLGSYALRCRGLGNAGVAESALGTAELPLFTVRFLQPTAWLPVHITGTGPQSSLSGTGNANAIAALITDIKDGGGDADDVLEQAGDEDERGDDWQAQRVTDLEQQALWEKLVSVHGCTVLKTTKCGWAQAKLKTDVSLVLPAKAFSWVGSFSGPYVRVAGEAAAQSSAGTRWERWWGRFELCVGRVASVQRVPESKRRGGSEHDVEVHFGSCDGREEGAPPGIISLPGGCLRHCSHAEYEADRLSVPIPVVRRTMVATFVSQPPLLVVKGLWLVALFLAGIKKVFSEGHAGANGNYWEAYEETFFRLFNGGYPHYLADCAAVGVFLHFHKHQRKLAFKSRAGRIIITVALFTFLVPVPALITHSIPMCVVYCWVIGPVVAVCLGVSRLAWRCRPRPPEVSARRVYDMVYYRRHYLRFLAVIALFYAICRLCFELIVTIVMQTSFNYAVMLYDGRPYFSNPHMEFGHRSVACFSEKGAKVLDFLRPDSAHEEEV